MMLALKSRPQIAAKVGNPAGLLCRRIWYSVGKSGVLGITEYRQGRPLMIHTNLLNFLSEPGRRTLNVLNYKLVQLLSTTKVLLEVQLQVHSVLEVQLQVHSVLGKCTKVHSEYFQNVLKYNQEYISITEQFFVP